MCAARLCVVASMLTLISWSASWGIEPAKQRQRGSDQTTAARPWKIGVAVRNLETGVEITEVLKNSPASLAHLEARDVIVTVNGQQVGIVAGRDVHLLDALAAHADTTGRVLLLVHNHRDGSLVNVPLRAMYDAAEAPPVIVEKPVIDPRIVVDHPGLKAVDGFYKTYLGRNAHPEELVKWQIHLERGGHLQDVQVEILSCDEFYSRCGGSFRQFVSDLYQLVVGRAPNAREVTRWEQRVQTQLGGSREKMVRLFFVLEVNNGREYP